MRLPPYLLVRDSGFYFRIAIPQDLRPHFGRTENPIQPLSEQSCAVP